ncbi:DUF4064 domain-containing protein [Staphylococcus sp. SQ8-PEA]|uniref:DUF4064 domain-containing protein n=1 Tax=Staphylococcus marylandisciuri TaxID=2981529 RepID=A0ABT2QQM0_9STAP|nr:DUF4064 domain-containing protein [Staphylococcus marylandisciuri]MCU5746247.1 DUF4064 domain-containing protein [Staphylococcus marylandisciuri]
MIKRTGEKVLTWIGIIISIIGIIFFAVIKPFLNDSDVKDSAAKSGQSIEEAKEGANVLSSFANTALTTMIISTILALIALFLIKKSRIWAGILLIIAGLVVLGCFNFIVTILFVIAGIMLLVRKPKGSDQENKYEGSKDENYRNDYNKEDSRHTNSNNRDAESRTVNQNVDHSNRESHSENARPGFTEANSEQEEPTQFGTTKKDEQLNQRGNSDNHNFTEANANEEQQPRFGKEHKADDIKEDIQEKSDDLHIKNPDNK